MDPEDPVVAQVIVAEYARLLEQHSQADQYPSPVSSLPYAKQVIKTAIRTCGRSMLATGQLTEELRDFLEVAYVSLADYVDEELVQLMTEYREAGATLSADGRLAKEKVETPAWKTLARTSGLAGEIARAIAEDTQVLRAEFRSEVTQASPS
jgi:hypothetical protein